MAMGDKIRVERNRRGLSIKELAELSGVSDVYIGKIERGQSAPSFEIVVKIAKVLEIPLSEFTDQVLTAEDQIHEKLREDLERTQLSRKDIETLLGLEDAKAKQSISNLLDLKDPEKTSVLRRNLYEIEQYIGLRGDVSSNRKIEIEALASEVRYYEARWIQTLDESPTSYKNFEGELEPIFCESGTEIRGKPLSYDKFVYWLVSFLPPLRRGQKACFVLKEKHENAFLMDKESILELMKKQQIRRERPAEVAGTLVHYPTSRLTRRLSLPTDFEIEDGWLEVKIKGVKDERERNRVMQENKYELKRIGGRWIFEMDVRNPIIGASYRFLWIPPSYKEYQELLIRKNRKAEQ